MEERDKEFKAELPTSCIVTQAQVCGDTDPISSREYSRAAEAAGLESLDLLCLSEMFSK